MGRGEGESVPANLYSWVGGRAVQRLLARGGASLRRKRNAHQRTPKQESTLHPPSSILHHPPFSSREKEEGGRRDLVGAEAEEAGGAAGLLRLSVHRPQQPVLEVALQRLRLGQWGRSE
eukprot:3355544-Rhodomonas_salina.1